MKKPLSPNYGESSSDTGTKSYVGESLEEALVKMFGYGTRTQTTTATATTGDIGTADRGTGQPSLQGLIEQANRYFNAGQEALRTGDWTEYGRYQQLLDETLRQLAQIAISHRRAAIK